jgi:hypothetical protein
METLATSGFPKNNPAPAPARTTPAAEKNHAPGWKHSAVLGWHAGQYTRRSRLAAVIGFGMTLLFVVLSVFPFAWWVAVGGVQVAGLLF